MAKKEYRWIYNPHQKSSSKVPGKVKLEMDSEANILIVDTLKSTYIKTPLKDEKWNYIIDIYSKWHGNNYYFISKYACPGPNAISPYFERRFARMEYIEGIGKLSKFNLYYMRHTEKWFEIFSMLSMEECLEEIKKGGWFIP